MMTLVSKATTARFTEKHVIAEGGHNDNWSLDIQGYFDALYVFREKCLSK